jgi:Tol biopolymer transport system component
MTAMDRFDRDFAVALVDLADAHYPDYFDDALDRAMRRAQRPAWTFLERWLPMSAIALRQPFGMPRLWRTMGILVILGLLLAAILFAVGSQRKLPPPYGLAANGSIVYAANGDIYVREAGTGADRKVVGGPETDVFPSYSRDGSFLTFVRLRTDDEEAKESLMIANTDGTAVRTVIAATVLHAFAVSPKGDELAIITELHGNKTLSIVAADGRTPPRSIEMEVVAEAGVEWRPPNGRELIFVGRSTASYAIHSVRPDGTGLERLSEYGDSQSWHTPFALSPDGTRMAATHWIGDTLSLVEIDIDTKRMRPFFSALPPPAAGVLVGPQHWGHATFSPDGTEVVFGRYWDEHDGTVNHQLWKAAADGDGSDAVPVTPVTRSQSGVGPFGHAFSPDGTKIMIQTIPTRELIIRDANGAHSEPLTWLSEELPNWQRVAR